VARVFVRLGDIGLIDDEQTVRKRFAFGQRAHGLERTHANGIDTAAHLDRLGGSRISVGPGHTRQRCMRRERQGCTGRRDDQHQAGD
jgi:hypothetical protein